MCLISKLENIPQLAWGNMSDSAFRSEAPGPESDSLIPGLRDTWSKTCVKKTQFSQRIPFTPCTSITTSSFILREMRSYYHKYTVSHCWFFSYATISTSAYEHFCTYVRWYGTKREKPMQKMLTEVGIYPWTAQVLAERLASKP